MGGGGGEGNIVVMHPIAGTNAPLRLVPLWYWTLAFDEGGISCYYDHVVGNFGGQMLQKNKVTLLSYVQHCGYLTMNLSCVTAGCPYFG